MMQGIPQTFNGKPRRHVWEYRSNQGEPIGCVARFDDGKKKEIVPYFKRINGHSWQHGSATEPRPLFGLDILNQATDDRSVLIVEGEKAAAALQSLGLVAITSQGGSNAAHKADWKPLNGRKRIYLLPDNDEAGESYIKAVAAILMSLDEPPALFIVRLPNLPPAGDVIDWIISNIDEVLPNWDGYEPLPQSLIENGALLNDFKEAAQQHCKPVPDEWKVTSEQADTTNWQAPISLESAKLPPWPDDVFPGSIQDFVRALSESTETPPELSAMLVLAAISAAAQGKYRVRVKADYFEPVNIWSCAALPPGSRKTAVQMAATAPLTKWENLQREKLEPAIKKAQADDATIREQLNFLRKQASKAKGAEFEQLKNEIADIEANLPEIPAVPQIWAQDVTPENLGTIMANNNERMAILSDEAGIFDILGGRYSGGIPNLDLFLQGHAGSAVRVNRGCRPPVFMQTPALTFGLSPQPDVLRGLTEKPSLRGRGLLGRFLYVLPASNLGYRTLDASPIFPDYKARYEGILTCILNQEMAGSKDEPLPHTLKITADALQTWESFGLKVEAELREGGTYAHLTDWAGKLAGVVIRIAALLHIARHALVKPWEKEINLEDMSAALRMADVLSIHAFAVFDLMGADPALDGARVVLRWIEREGKSEFTFRDCHYAHKTRYKRTAELEPIMEVLIERHYIRPRALKQAQGRPSRIYEVNPIILEK
ncbi:YfjI family protein [Nitrosomonas ureae]|uniref:DUF3987 domain-containing protein n=1 Tax=Nitrosomonas ureae TaxID=44577 RepID=A0A1H5RWF8_9PROT|nr:YfjI family protein [Nitrosomonas ureae]SEF42672.1 Protein of unknown function [Nitrosomonas ureae]